MKKLMFVSAVAVVLFMSSGCSTTTIPMNYQRSVARSAGDLSSTVALSTKKVSREQIVEAVKKVEMFLDGNTIPENITRDELIELVKEQIDIEQIKPLIDRVAVVMPENVNLKDGIKVIRAFLMGMDIGMISYIEVEE